MSITSLTQAEAQAKLAQAEDAQNHAHQLVQSMQSRTVEMTASSWQGTQATKFANAMQQHTDEFNGILNQLTHAIETGRHNINTQINVESE